MPSGRAGATPTPGMPASGAPPFLAEIERRVLWSRGPSGALAWRGPCPDRRGGHPSRRHAHATGAQDRWLLRNSRNRRSAGRSRTTRDCLLDPLRPVEGIGDVRQALQQYPGARSVGDSPIGLPCDCAAGARCRCPPRPQARWSRGVPLPLAAVSSWQRSLVGMAEARAIVAELPAPAARVTSNASSPPARLRRDSRRTSRPAARNPSPWGRSFRSAATHPVRAPRRRVRHRNDRPPCATEAR
jgi:hypothetical protein